MSKYRKPIRSEKNILSDDQVKIFYEEILLFTESDRTAYGSAKAIFKKVKNNKKFQRFDFEYVDYETKMQKPCIDTFYFSAESKKEKAKGQKPKNSEILQKWFSHLRNAFAHNYIIKDNNLFVLRDYRKEDFKPTLYVELSSFELFIDLVRTIKQVIIGFEKKSKK